MCEESAVFEFEEEQSKLTYTVTSDPLYYQLSRPKVLPPACDAELSMDLTVEPFVQAVTFSEEDLTVKVYEPFDRRIAGDGETIFSTLYTLRIAATVGGSSDTYYIVLEVLDPCIDPKLSYIIGPNSF